MLLSGSDILVKTIIEQNCDTVFGYPGGQILNVYDSLYKYQDEINHVLTAHEQGATHAADGYARTTGKVGVVRPVDSDDIGALGQLKQYREQLEKEAELGQTIRNSSVRAIGLWKNFVPSAITVDGETYTEVSDGIYSILERMDRKGKTFNQLLQYISEPPAEDTPLKTGFLPKVHTTALIIEQVLFALERIHTAGEKGFLFGDIQDGNVFFSDCRLKQGDIGIGRRLWNMSSEYARLSPQELKQKHMDAMALAKRTQPQILITESKHICGY